MLSEKVIKDAVKFAKNGIAGSEFSDEPYGLRYKKVSNGPIEYNGFECAGAVAIIRKNGGRRKSLIYDDELMIPKMVRLDGLWYIVTAIGEKAFAGMGNGPFRLNIPDTIMAIGDSAFEGSDVDGTVDISSMAYVGRNAFLKCENVRRIIFPSPSELNDYAIPDGICYKNTYLSEIQIPEGYREVGKCAFAYTRNVKSVAIPDSVEAIRREAFWGSASIHELVLPKNLNYIGNAAFGSCMFHSVIFSKNPESIQMGAFNKCTNLNNIVWSTEPIKYIGDCAFRRCDFPDEFKVPPFVKRFFSSAFCDNERLNTILVHSGTKITWATEAQRKMGTIERMDRCLKPMKPTKVVNY